MKTIRISDITLPKSAMSESAPLTFREKLETAKMLDRIGVSVIELGELTGQTADKLLIKSVAASVKDAVIAVCAGFDPATVADVWDALKEAKHPRLQVYAAVSTARMEYIYHKKAAAMLDMVCETVRYCRTLCDDVEFIAEDATRADADFLQKILTAAVEAGATTVTVCDTAGVFLPDEFGDFIAGLAGQVPGLREVTLGVLCADPLTCANACALAAVKNGAGEIKVTANPAGYASLAGISKMLSAKADALGIRTTVRTTEINRVLQQIRSLADKPTGGKSPFEDGVRRYSDEMVFTSEDTVESLAQAAAKLGYTLDDNDKMRVWKAFCDIAQRKDAVSAGELDAIIASEAMQVPPTYTLENFIVTTGNAIDILAHIKLKRGNEILDGLSLGDGPIDAAFLAIEQITGHHYELDDFQIQAVTEGREAMGQTIVKLRSGGKIYSGKGLSTDIIGSGVLAYVNALNKIIYEEENG